MQLEAASAPFDIGISGTTELAPSPVAFQIKEVDAPEPSMADSPAAFVNGKVLELGPASAFESESTGAPISMVKLQLQPGRRLLHMG